MALNVIRTSKNRGKSYFQKSLGKPADYLPPPYFNFLRQIFNLLLFEIISNYWQKKHIQTYLIQFKQDTYSLKGGFASWINFWLERAQYSINTHYLHTYIIKHHCIRWHICHKIHELRIYLFHLLFYKKNPVSQSNNNNNNNAKILQQQHNWEKAN